MLTTYTIAECWLVRGSRTRLANYPDRTGDLQIFSLALSQLSYNTPCAPTEPRVRRVQGPGATRAAVVVSNRGPSVNDRGPG